MKKERTTRIVVVILLFVFSLLLTVPSSLWLLLAVLHWLCS